MTTQNLDEFDLDAFKIDLKELAHRAQRNLMVEVQAGGLDFERADPRAALMAEMERLVKEDMRNGN